jgi:hypothetical protein
MTCFITVVCRLAVQLVSINRARDNVHIHR